MAEARRLSVLALVPYPLGRAPGQRYRIEQWAPYLQHEGIDVTWARDLWDLDVGIMPLVDGPWARGKCAMKAIRYLGVGVPAVVSPVGANLDVVRHGESGFHAATEDDRVENLERLLLDPLLPFGQRRGKGRRGSFFGRVPGSPSRDVPEGSCGVTDFPPAMLAFLLTLILRLFVVGQIRSRTPPSFRR